MKSLNARAFTLVELLVSMAILSGLIILLFSVVDGTTRTWNQAEQRVDAFREARAALFVITRDLESIVPAPDIGPEPYPPPTPPPDPSSSPIPTPTPTPQPNGVADFKYFFVNPSFQGNNGTDDIGFSNVTANGNFGIASDAYADRLFFITAQPTNAQLDPTGTKPKSDICLVGYYLKYAPPLRAGSGAPNAFNLYRYFKNSDTAFKSLRDYADGTNKTLMAPTATDDVLARNVVDFRVTYYNESFKVIDLMAGDPDFAKVMPYAVDLSITAYNYNVANRLAAPQDWIAFRKPAADPSKDAASRQTFSTRVYISRRGPAPVP